MVWLEVSPTQNHDTTFAFELMVFCGFTYLGYAIHTHISLYKFYN